MAQANKGVNKLRIIGGEWRSRQLPFIDAPSLRPTPNRVRETLFNWLQGDIAGARCLDLFAGSGAIAFEALSRYAAEVVLVEMHKKAAKQLTENLSILEGESESRGLVVNQDALKYVASSPEPFDVIFLDPPYRKNFLPTVLDQVNSLALLKPGGVIYLEHEREESFDWSDWGLEVIKQSKAGQVMCFLLKKGA
ncbi:16S rRNA (guanine(966)-N(2))-methyltransferase RsmD [Leucothrix arctica]|uniref:Ribosomal RNA small subunit methyltransferase D n=1 Tax=Leucothrix arctica TaxID=1481894 RepID=A0A317CEP9_9GAMM|nr:16S rRNA (guanine(966)-N(2))-methyltransferase RsmD [Leucothrix arctica]PWQ94780.1 16S rRNA (guanine(966)-N(2))-methyltransferase RsmD [Leucothrix arctica]